MASHDHRVMNFQAQFIMLTLHSVLFIIELIIDNYFLVQSSNGVLWDWLPTFCGASVYRAEISLITHV